MDNCKKMPYISEDTKCLQRVQIYFDDLKNRLKQLKLRHEEIIQHSVEMINELGAVSSSLLDSDHEATYISSNINIKKLINDFENIQTASYKRNTVQVESNVDIRKILNNFEKLNESHALKDSLMLFRRAKEKFEKIDSIFIKNKPEAKCPLIQQREQTENTRGFDASANVTIKRLPYGVAEGDYKHKERDSQFASCSSSLLSISSVYSNADNNKNDRDGHLLDIGYEGDNDDSEVDLRRVLK